MRAEQDILPVARSKEDARRFYDRISGVYDYLTGTSERRYSAMALNLLSVGEGQSVLEIGCGTGHSLKRIAELVGRTGKAYGVDISAGMLHVAGKRLAGAGLTDRVELYCGDALSLPYVGSAFHAVFMSFTLELFDTPEIPLLLREVKRVLRPGGKLGVISMSAENGASLMLRLYQWAHGKWPAYIDCRPIYVERALKHAGYAISSREKVKLFGLPVEIAVASKDA